MQLTDELKTLDRQRCKKSTSAVDETNMIMSLKDLLDAFPFYVMLIDEDHHILLANKAVEIDLGMDPEQIIGGYCPKVVHGLDKPYPGCPLEEAVKKGCAVERELFDTNTRRWLISAIYPTGCRTKEGRAIFIHMVHDITERKKLEKQRRKAYSQIEKNIEQFAILVDHIRNYLAVIVGLAELKVADKETSQKIIQQARKIEKVIEQLDKGWLESEKIREFLRSY